MIPFPETHTCVHCLHHTQLSQEHHGCLAHHWGKTINNLDEIESHLQGEDFLPNWSQCLVLSVCVHPVIHYLQNCKRITFTSQISRMESLRFDNFHNKVTNILHLVQGVRHFLKYICVLSIYQIITYIFFLQLVQMLNIRIPVCQV